LTTTLQSTDSEVAIPHPGSRQSPGINAEPVFHSLVALLLFKSHFIIKAILDDSMFAKTLAKQGWPEPIFPWPEKASKILGVTFSGQDLPAN